MHRRTNPIVSIHRSNITVDSLRRMNNVTGTEFPVSGDAPLRQEYEILKDRMDSEAKLARKIALSANYGKSPIGGPDC